MRGIAMVAALPAGHPQAGYAHGHRGINLIELGRPAEALPELDAAVATAPDVAHWMAWRARALVEAGDPRRGLVRADEAVARALATDPDSSERRRGDESLARWHRARALVALGRRDEARREIAVASSLLATATAADARALGAAIARWSTAQLR